MELNVKRVNETKEKLLKIKENLSEAEKPHSYSFREIFTDDFMREYTNSENIQDFLDRSGLDFSHDAKSIIESESFNAYVIKNTKFTSWEEMKFTASKILLNSKIMG